MEVFRRGAEKLLAAIGIKPKFDIVNVELRPSENAGYFDIFVDNGKGREEKLIYFRKGFGEKPLFYQMVDPEADHYVKVTDVQFYRLLGRGTTLGIEVEVYNSPQTAVDGLKVLLDDIRCLGFSRNENEVLGVGIGNLPLGDLTKSGKVVSSPRLDI